jgi:hypothetical protein
MALTTNELIERLNKRKMQPAAMSEIMRVIDEQKKHLRVQRGKNYQFSRMWEELMTPLKYERKMVKALLCYPASEERRIALDAYWHELDKLVGKMTLQQRARDFTPYQMARAANRPNNGVHWSDWIPQEIKEAVIEAFGEIPRAGIKVKVPFERKIPATLHIKLKKRLRDRTQKEYDLEWRKNTTDYTDERAARIKQMKQAMEWIDALVDGEAMPTTWHGFYR